MGYDEIQGFLDSKPQPAREYEMGLSERLSVSTVLSAAI